ncbi:uncharacterized protein LOC143146583 isoform X2 [Ptiloglossa arizonensis]|uniref:uncharacterized protein LOC143146583 isoform X2 n=1 Tax=Ptiloglossa arizonensis TaxID=3350558 RepID=UPI003FA00805
MENQGFEEEHQPRIEGGAFSRQSSGHESRKYFPPPRIDLLSALSSSDSHVYEDVLPVVEDVSKPACPSSAQDTRRSFDVVDCASREDVSDREDITGLRRNLTLPFRRGNDHESSVASCSVRVTNREKNVRREETEIDEDAPIATRAQSIESRPNRRRRKKDCKHCRSKAAAKEHETDDKERAEESTNVLRRNRDNEHQRPRDSESLEETNLGPNTDHGKPNDSLTIYTIAEKIGQVQNTVTLIEYERNHGHATETNNKEDRALIASEKSRAGMRVNSIYSQDRWYAKEAPIFFTDVKEHGSFQRAYSLPVRTQTPSSQNRVNLRRSVRGEPPPHPARLRKHRHGWTLHFARPLEASGCTRSLVVLLILVLTLLGIGAAALYIVFEPEKLQMIQQYLKSSAASHSSHNNTLSAGTFLQSAISGQQSDISTASTTTTTTSTTTATAALSSSTLMASVLLSGDQSFSERGAQPVLDAETEATSVNSTRYCDDCLHGEVCVALVDEEVPVCRIGLDREDPTGCAGFCIVNKQKCHRLDVDAFRCVEIEHYCLDDEWTCSNTLCIPLNKHCDGHMNCYDHSDEYNCDCDLETHFQCGNETSCLPLEKRCDGKIDCWDAADEINCTLACPSENEFTCSNGQCISKARFCDGLPDCVDRSDEPHGCQGRCNKHEFTCQNSRCIAKGMKCNGIDDCGDGTDERHCKDRFS